MLKYSEDIKNTCGVIVHEIQKEKYLYFVPDGSKYRYCSNDENLQNWCCNEKNKRVYERNIRYVVDAAQKALAENPHILLKKDCRKASWSVNPVAALNEYCQKNKLELPVYEVVDIEQANGKQTVSVAMYMVDFDVVFKADSKKEAQKKCALEYADKILHMDVEYDENPSWQICGNKKLHSFDMPIRFPFENYDWENNPICALNDFCMQNLLQLPKYKRKILSINGKQIFDVSMVLPGIKTVFKGKGENLKEAKCAAIDAYKKFASFEILRLQKEALTAGESE